MRKSTIACFAVVILSVAPAHAQYTTQQQAHAARQAEIRRQNYAQQEAIRFLFGPQGIPALTRPSDPWNYCGPATTTASRTTLGTQPAVITADIFQ